MAGKKELPDRQQLQKMRTDGWRLDELETVFGIPGSSVWAILTSEITDEETEAFFRENGV
ncbi:hypothetical protein [Arthrobacter mobilis]|uniref:Uncharacterized protein n=1 Tax=Arthrobacter mobilis TaxID=2724944 RepID=A0A7X6HF15_9MICC|nr:hypothetical protein [Arthrobacter mobilis]NKX55977.1 hypothetical protein [Arthrobacter mobilis]